MMSISLFFSKATTYLQKTIIFIIIFLALINLNLVLIILCFNFYSLNVFVIDCFKILFIFSVFITFLVFYV
jgi:hypothetical protein